ncbi:TPA: hypothetical protein PXQ25_003712 [Yersinia enterocolitica]|nr:hypothetical protein [Yersinia enterocolitica]
MITFLSWQVPLRVLGVAGVIHFGHCGVVLGLLRGVLGCWRCFWTGVKKPAFRRLNISTQNQLQS